MQKKLSGQGCGRQFDKRYSFSWTIHCSGSSHLLHQGKTFTSTEKAKNTDMYTRGTLFVDMSSKQEENMFQQYLKKLMKLAEI